MAKKVTTRSKTTAPKAEKSTKRKPVAKKASSSGAAKKPRTKAVSAAATAPAQPPAAIQHERAKAFAIQAARMLADDKCDQIVVIDVRGKSPMSDLLIIGSGTSERQMRSALAHLEDLGAQSQYPCHRSASDDRGTWLLADFFNVVVHLFEPSARAHYDLEMMWGDAPRLAWERPSPPAKRARPAARAPRLAQAPDEADGSGDVQG
jgi:ribosome-associated protein